MSISIPGRYLLGISRGKPVAHARHRPRSTIGPPSRRSAHCHRRQTSSPTTTWHMPGAVSGAYEVSGDVQGSVDEYAWTLSPADATHSWELGLRAPVGLVLYENLLASTRPAARVGQGRAGWPGRDPRPAAAGRHVHRVRDPVSPRPRCALRHPQRDRHDRQRRPGARTTTVPMRCRSTRPGASRLRSAGRTSETDDYLLRADGRSRRPRSTSTWATARPAQNHELCLIDPVNVELQCRSGKGDLRLSNLVLPIGDYAGRADRRRQPGQRLPSWRWSPSVRPSPTGRWNPTTSSLTRPPSTRPWSSRVGPMARMTTTSTSRSRATRSCGDWTRPAPRIDSLDWVQRTGQTLATTPAAADGTSASLTDLYLIPGDHWFHVAAHDGAYALTLTSLGPPDPERRAGGQQRRGPRGAPGYRPDPHRVAWPTTADVDVYRFSLDAPEHVVVALTPPADGTISDGYRERRLVHRGAGRRRRRGSLDDHDAVSWSRATTRSGFGRARSVTRRTPSSVERLDPLPRRMPSAKQLPLDADADARRHRGRRLCRDRPAYRQPASISNTGTSGPDADARRPDQPLRLVGDAWRSRP